MRPLTVNETKFNSRNAFIGNFFALESEKESKNNERTVFRDCQRRLVNPETLNGTCMWFCEVFQFWLFSSHLQFLLELKTNFSKLQVKIWMKPVKLLSSRYTRFLLGTKPVQRNWVCFLKKFKKHCSI